jgi:hypothetical protein
VEDTAGLGGTVPAIEQLGECIRAAQQVMAYARHEDGNVRSAKILLTAADGFAIEFWPRRADGFWPTCRPST